MDIFGSDSSCCLVEARLKGGVRGVHLSFGRQGRHERTVESLITAVSFIQKEKVSVLPCFNNKNYVYAFGHDAAASMVEVTALCSVCPGSNALRDAVQNYARYRVSRNTEMVTVSYGTLAIRGVLVSISSNTVDARLNLQSVTYVLLLLDCIGSKT